MPNLTWTEFTDFDINFGLRWRMVSDIYFQPTKKLHWHNGMELLAVCLCCILYFANKRKRPINILGFIIISKVVMSIITQVHCIIWTFCVLKINYSVTKNHEHLKYDLPSFLLLFCNKVQNVCVKLSNNWANEIQLDNLKQNYGKTFRFF